MLGLSSPALIFFIFWEGVIGAAVVVVVPLLGVVAGLVVVQQNFLKEIITGVLAYDESLGTQFSAQAKSTSWWW